MKIVIFCGGYGTRMWPASRKSSPKQFYPLLSGKSFFRITLDRFLKEYSPADIYVSTEHKYAKFVHDQAPELPHKNVILEPERRDNLAAIGLSVSLIHHLHPKEVIFFSWSDHLIKNEKEFLSCVKLAGEYAASTGVPVSVDQEPTFPTVHSGWLKLGSLVSKLDGRRLYEIDKHIEKPNLQTARRLFRSSKYLIHTGYGAWRSDVLVGYYEKYAPDTYKRLQKIVAAYGSPQYDAILKKEYAEIEKISIDYGLFEKIPSHERCTIRADFGWKDVGTWQLMYESLAEEAEFNVIEGDIKTQFMESSGNLILGQGGKMISVLGLSNIAVIDTPTGLLVSSLEKTSLVKNLFTVLEKENPEFVE